MGTPHTAAAVLVVGAIAAVTLLVWCAHVCCCELLGAVLSHLCTRLARLLRSPSSPPRRRGSPRYCGVPPPLVCAHGGDVSGGALANTLPAYRAALAHPAVRCVEVDVSRTRDDALVALHQRQLLSIAGGEFDRCAHERMCCFQRVLLPSLFGDLARAG